MLRNLLLIKAYRHAIKWDVQTQMEPIGILQNCMCGNYKLCFMYNNPTTAIFSRYYPVRFGPSLDVNTVLILKCVKTVGDPDSDLPT